MTALGETDAPGGWRENKASGGILMDVETSEIVLTGLSMPHSPRWFEDRLWVLESGKGTLSVADLEAGRSRRSPSSPVSRGGCSSRAASPSSASRRCGRPPPSAGCP